jgi:hypothetical protein
MAQRSVIASVLLAACVQGPTVPKLGGGAIELKVRASLASLGPGESDSIVVTATNSLTEIARIRFRVDVPCQILVYIRDQSGRTVLPAGGQHSCVPVPSLLTIPANGSVDRVFIWKGGSAFEPPGSPTRLPPGDYFVSASMDADGFSVPGFAITVTLRP